ncbi:MAG: TraB/GumN family protein, partial [Candidatus Aenigmatarchaeota archaeon]
MGAGDIERLKIRGKEIILIGTAHISEESVKLVQKTIKAEKPDSVGVELCESRFKTISEKQKWDETKITTILKNGQAPLFLSNLLLSSFQRRLGKDLGVRPGAEMIEGINAAKEAKAEVVLLDRDITVTLKRAWKAMGVFEKLKVFSSLFYGLFAGEDIDEEMVECLKEKNMITELMEELSREAPSAKKVLI